jgi:hypothetical protein
METIVTMQEIRNKSRDHWFSPDSMRFFNTRLPQTGYMFGDKMYFITSEQFVDGSYRADRMYTIRCLNITTGHTDTVGEFNKMTKSQAHTALKILLKEDAAVK